MCCSAIAHNFRTIPPCTDLDHWHAFEQQNPHTFARMYQFVVQKQA